jgi:hypothetical protein
MKNLEEVRNKKTSKIFFFYKPFSFFLIGSSQMIRAPKSLREWHEQPVNLLEQPSLLEKVNVQILSPNSERVK